MMMVLMLRMMMTPPPRSVRARALPTLRTPSYCASHSAALDDVPDETDVEEETMIQPEQEAIDIDDATASGRLSALRREMATDTETKPDTKDDLSRRLDSFLKDR